MDHYFYEVQLTPPNPESINQKILRRPVLSRSGFPDNKIVVDINVNQNPRTPVSSPRTPVSSPRICTIFPSRVCTPCQFL